MTGTPASSTDSLNVEQAVRERYSAASQAVAPALCCPVNYESRYLEVLPQDLIDRDYGCGDPSKYVSEGETVVDLGSGGGKICYIASQITGPSGRVYGVDMNDDMLELARGHQSEISQRIGWDNVSFHKGRIQDLALDLDAAESYFAQQPVQSAAGWLQAEAELEKMRAENPMIPSGSVDVVISNCVLNLVNEADRKQMFAEIFRVLKRGGRAVISDIVSDEPAPEHLRNNAELWSGCISGAFVENEFLKAFEEAGFYGVEVLTRQADAWAVVEGIEFRSMTVRAYKGKDGPCRDYNQAVVYNGPWKTVTDDDGHVLRRGERMAVCQKTFDIYSKSPYAGAITAIQPHTPVSDEDSKPFDCRPGTLRTAKEIKGKPTGLNILPGEACCSDDSDSGSCC